MKQHLLVFLLTVFVVATVFAGEQEVFLDNSVYDTAKIPMVVHTGSGPYQSYLVQNVPYAPVLAVNKKIASIIGRKLKTRGEAHITVITPPEYDRALKGIVSIERIHQLAEQWTVQEMTFDVICVGSGKAELEGKMEETFFLVVRSEDLFNLRKEIEKMYLERGGKPGGFVAEKYYPHITIGYTKSDLHIHQGVVKNETSKDERFKLRVGL